MFSLLKAVMMGVSVYGDDEVNTMQIVVFERQIDGGGSVMVWGGISFRHRTPLTIIDGTLTAQSYIGEVLLPAVAPFFAAPIVMSLTFNRIMHGLTLLV
jgi:hypothetical protein